MKILKNIFIQIIFLFNLSFSLQAAKITEESKKEKNKPSQQEIVQKLLQNRCELSNHTKARTQHCFVDSTHHTCCKLGPKSRSYSDRSGNPIGTASEYAASFLSKNLREQSISLGVHVLAQKFVAITHNNLVQKTHLSLLFINQPRFLLRS